MAVFYDSNLAYLYPEAYCVHPSHGSELFLQVVSIDCYADDLDILS